MAYFIRVLLLVSFIVMTAFVTIGYAQLTAIGEDDKSEVLPSYLQYKSYGNVRTDYSVAHRTQDEIVSWVSGNTANIMTFDARNVSEHFEDIKKLFVRTGWKEFIKYVDNAQLREEVLSNGYALNSIVEGRAFIKREGPLSNVYRWVVDIPVLMSFYQLDEMGKVRPGISASAQIGILVTVTRVAKGGGAERIAISGWKVVKRGRDLGRKRGIGVEFSR